MNNYVACKPFETLAIQKQGSNFITVKQKSSLYWTEVIYNVDHNFAVGPGTKVAVAGTDLTLPWSRTVYNNDGVEFILIPMTNVLLVHRPDDLPVPKPFHSPAPFPALTVK